MRQYVRALLCDRCASVCELIGALADTWECTTCGSCYAATADDAERWSAEPEQEDSGYE